MPNETVLQSLLGMTDYDAPPGINYDWVERRWPEGEVERCVATGLLHPAKPARRLSCPECGDIVEVVFIESGATKELLAYLPCGEAGPVPVPMERLKTWEMSFEQFMDAVFAEIALAGGREEIVRDRVWRLGRTRWVDRSWNVFFARGLHRSDAWTVLNQAKFTSRSVVFVPSELPRDDSRIEVSPVIIPLTAVLSWEGTVIHFDHEYVEGQLADTLAALPQQAPDKPPRPKRGSRAALIEALTHELGEHLRSARDYAVATEDRTGTPQLLPRPKQELLARKLNVDKSSVSRCLADRSARELRFLWDVAGDVDRILEHAGRRC